MNDGGNQSIRYSQQVIAIIKRNKTDKHTTGERERERERERETITETLKDDNKLKVARGELGGQWVLRRGPCDEPQVL